MTRWGHKHKMTRVTLFCETGQKKVTNRSFTSHLEMLLQDLMLGNCAMEPTHLFSKSGKRKAGNQIGEVVCHHMLF